MRYNLELIRDNFRKGVKQKFLFFWGHRKSNDGSITASCFSQWWMSDFVVNGVKYSCAEQYMMASKARLFKDEEIFKEILKTNNQGKIKALGRKVNNFNENVWNNEKYNIVLQGNIAKFSQNDELKTFLLNTGDKVIVEASPYDRVWGIGMTRDDNGVENPCSWKGENLLGFALMEARDKLKL